MKNIADIRKQLKIELESWYLRQVANPDQDFYLYYRPTNKKHDGTIFITSGQTLFSLASPERIHKGMTVEQNFNRISVSGILNKLPVLG